MAYRRALNRKKKKNLSKQQKKKIFSILLILKPACDLQETCPCSVKVYSLQKENQLQVCNSSFEAATQTGSHSQ